MNYARRPGKKNDTLSAAGVNVDFSDTAEQQLRIAVITAGTFRDEVMIAAAGIDGTFERELTCFAADLSLSGTFNDNVTLKAARIIWIHQRWPTETSTTLRP